MSTKIAYYQYNPAQGIWKCFDQTTGQLTRLNDFQMMTTKASRKKDQRILFKTAPTIHTVKQQHPDLKLLNLSTAKDKANQNIEDNATNQELEHPSDNNKLFIDCFLSDSIDSFSSDVIALGANNIQTTSDAVSHIFQYYGLNHPANQIVRSLAQKKITFDQASSSIQKIMDHQVIRFIPFGSQLQKKLKKVLRRSGYGYEGVIGGCSDNLFGFFYMEDKDQNIIKDIMQKANHETL